MPDAAPLREGDPTVLGGYRLVGRLGEGGQGVVYLGQGPDDAPVAVKVVRSELAADPKVRSRFAREVTAARRVTAQFCVAQVLDADVSATPPYVVTEYIDGPTLSRSVRGDGPRSGAALHRLAVATATALAAIHEAGVAHRDFKPANVLLGSDGPRVIDFGIARTLDISATQTGGIVGTPSYMAPEQFHGKAAAPADVFAWGCVMVFAAGGHPPFTGGDIPVLINQILHHEPDPGRLAEPLRGIVLACLRKDPAARPTMQQVLMRLLGRPADFPAAPPALPPGFPSTPAPAPAGVGSTGPAADATTLEPGSRGRLRPPRPLLAAVGGAVLVTAVVVLGVLLRPLLEESKGASPAGPSASSVSGGGGPVSGPTSSPRLGLQFWQNGTAAPMAFEDAEVGPGIVATVGLKSAPFQLRFPDRGDDMTLAICAWTDDSVFTDREGQVVERDGCFGTGRGIADFEFGSGTLYLNDEGFNYLIGNRFQNLSPGTNKVDYSKTYLDGPGIPLREQRGDLYLAVYMRQADDGRFHITGPAELEYVVLRFPS